MANTKSAIKRIRRISKQTAVNKARKSRYKNALKKMNSLIQAKKEIRSIKILTQVEFRAYEDCEDWYNKKTKMPQGTFQEFQKNFFNVIDIS